MSDGTPKVEVVKDGIDVIVVRGTIVVGYAGKPVMGVNPITKEKCIVAHGPAIERGPGDRVTLPADEANRLLALGTVRLPMVDGNLPAPGGPLPRDGTDAEAA